MIESQRCVPRSTDSAVSRLLKVNERNYVSALIATGDSTVSTVATGAARPDVGPNSNFAINLQKKSYSRERSGDKN